PYVHLGIRVTADPQGYLDPLTLLPPREVAPLPTGGGTLPAPSPAPAPPVGASPPTPAPSAPAPPDPNPTASPAPGPPPVTTSQPWSSSTPASTEPQPAASWTATPSAPAARKPAAPSTPAQRRVVRHERSGSCLALGCALAGLRRPGHHGAGVREPMSPAPIISSSELLPDHTDLLRERSPAHRARVHDDCGRYRRPPSAPAWGGRVLPHGRG